MSVGMSTAGLIARRGLGLKILSGSALGRTGF
jgi:hypothetical protein